MELDGTLPEDPVKQLENALANISNNLLEANMEIRDIVKLNMLFVGEIDVEGRREVMAEWLKGHEPCETLVYAAALATPKIKVEIEAVACSDVE
jgi:enamine deaminase RidA (YjgF/YER057c/UK114 family)